MDQGRLGRGSGEMLELYGAPGCPYTRELREDLLWKGRAFREYDVEADPEAMRRLRELTGGCTVPVLVENGRVVQVGYQGRGCTVFLTPAGDRTAEGQDGS